MPVKDNWANGQTVDAADLNELGGAVNALEESAVDQTDIDTALAEKVAKNSQVFNVLDHGAVADGSTSNTTAFAALVDTVVAAGGGTIVFPPATSQYIGSLVIDANLPINIVGYGATLQGPSGGAALTINTGQTGGSGQSVVVEGLTIKGNADQTTDGVLVRDTSRARIENCYITRVNNGVRIQNYASGQNSEATLIRATFINDAVTGIRMEIVSGGPSFDETILHDVGINNVTTGIYLPTGSNHIRSCFDATVWVGRTGSTNGVALYTDADMKRVWGRLGGELYIGATSGAGMQVGPNAFGFAEADLQLHFQGSINPAVDLTPASTGQYAMWRHGLTSYGAAKGAATGNILGPHTKVSTDTFPRCGFSLGSPANAPMPGGRDGIFFGSGLAEADVALYRPGIAGVLHMRSNNSFRTGASSTGSMPSAATHGQGAQHFDTTLNRPKWSDGTNWISLTDRAAHTGTQTASTISDFTEAAQDAVNALLAGASGVTLSYDDTANTLTITGPGAAGLDAEAVRDAIGVALVGAGPISIAVNDGADTITVSTTATVNDTDANLRDRATHTGTQTASTISDFNTAADARVAAGGTHLLASSFPTVTSVANTTTETAVASLTVPSASLLAGDLLVFELAWDTLNNTGSSVNYTYRFKVGATTIATTNAIAAGTSVQRVGARGRFLIALPALNTPRVWGEFFASFATAGFGGINAAHSGVLIPSEPSVDFSSDVVIQLTCQMGTASASADFRPHAATLTRQR